MIEARRKLRAWSRDVLPHSSLTFYRLVPLGSLHELTSTKRACDWLF